MRIASIRSQWEGGLADGRFPLLEWLGGSDDRGVFLTVLQGIQRAAIKLIVDEGTDADAYIAQWEAAKALSHPHLTGVLETGRCAIEGTNVVYVVTEYAEETLTQIIQERALGPDEARDIFDPVLDALSYLHGQGFIHGRVKPSNILVVADQVKLSGDDLLVAGEDPEQARIPGNYDAPEWVNGTLAPSVDAWSVGMTLAEALTQHPVAWDWSAIGEPQVPESLPQPLSELVRECLQSDPAQRCTIEDIKAQLASDMPLPEAAKPIPPTPRPTETKPAAPEAKPIVPATEPIPPQVKPAPSAPEPVESAPEPPRAATALPRIPGQPVWVGAEALEEEEPAEFNRGRTLFADIEESNRSRFPGIALVMGLLVVLAVVGFLMVKNNKLDLAALFKTLSAPATSQTAQQTQPQEPPPGETPSAPATSQAVPQPQAPPTPPNQAQTPPSAGPSAPKPTPQESPSDENQSAPATGKASPPQQSPESQTDETESAPVKSAPMTGQSTPPTESPEAERLNGVRTEGAVAKRVLPNVQQDARRSIRGIQEVSIRVWVDRNGTVSNATYMSSGPGNYFARSAFRAAHAWKFTPPNSEGHPTPSVWTLRFYFRQTDTEVNATEERR